MTSVGPNGYIEVDEIKFYKILLFVVEQKSQEESLDWILTSDIYEILGTGITENIGFREFCAFVFLVAAA